MVVRKRRRRSGICSLPGAGNSAGKPCGTVTPGCDGDFDLSSFERFFNSCDRVIVGALARQPIQQADREDCRQEIWVELLASRMSGFRGGNLAAWLGKLARNKAVDTIRLARRHAVGSAIAATLHTPVAQERPHEADEPRAVVWLALAELERQIEQRSYAVFFLRSVRTPVVRPDRRRARA